MAAGMTGQTGSGTGARPGPDDAVLLRAVRELWQEADPVPPTLSERICMALRLRELEVELLRMEPELVGARGEERVRTITFSSPSLSVMVTIADEGADAVRVDGWADPEGSPGDGDAAPGGQLRVELRSGATSRDVAVDGDGRFSVDEVPHGLVQFVFHLESSEAPAPRLPVVTPAFEV
jgi:hypothetical protein